MKSINNDANNLIFVCFRFTVIGATIQITNVFVICYATSKRTKNTSPIIEEKGNGAIMLY